MKIDLTRKIIIIVQLFNRSSCKDKIAKRKDHQSAHALIQTCTQYSYIGHPQTLVILSLWPRQLQLSPKGEGALTFDVYKQKSKSVLSWATSPKIQTLLTSVTSFVR